MEITALVVAMIGWWGTWFAYNMSVERGRHRRTKRGVWDFGRVKARKDAAEEYEWLTGLFWQGDQGREAMREWNVWTGAKQA